MITLVTISQGKLGLSAEERVELDRLRRVVADHKRQIAELTHNYDEEIRRWKDEVAALEDELRHPQSAAPWNKYDKYTYKANEYKEYITNDMYTYTKLEDKF